MEAAGRSSLAESSGTRCGIQKITQRRLDSARCTFYSGLTVVNGTLESSESIAECRRRELIEEAGIHDVIRWGDEIYRFSFLHKDDVISVIVSSAIVPEGQVVVINDEHTEYRWVSFDEAIRMSEFDDDKKGLKICREKSARGEIYEMRKTIS